MLMASREGGHRCRLADEILWATGFFVHWGPVFGGPGGGWGRGWLGFCGWRVLRERSQFLGNFFGTEDVEVLVEGLVVGGTVLTAGAAGCGVGAVPGGFAGGGLALDAGEEVCGG